MIIRPNIYNDVLLAPYQSGLRDLEILSGYCSSSFLHHVVNELPHATFRIIVGMAGTDGIPCWDHLEYRRLIETTRRLSVFYYAGRPPIHAKGVLWREAGTCRQAFMGSANFTWNGYRDYSEVMVAADPLLAPSILPHSDLISAMDENVETFINISNPMDPVFAPRSLGTIAQNREVVHLSLLDSRTGDAPGRSGLNWGQRPGREPNQAYLSVPKSVHDQHPDFFPDLDREFTIITDDGISFVCVVAQQNRKAIETRYDNSILGRYFRNRLDVPLGERVSRTDLDRYGRTGFSIHKISDDTYYLDFSRGEFD